MTVVWQQQLCKFVGKNRVSGKDLIGLLFRVLVLSFMFVLLAFMVFMVGDLICGILGIIQVVHPIQTNSWYTIFVIISVGLITFMILTGILIGLRTFIPWLSEKADNMTIAQCPSVKNKP